MSLEESFERAKANEWRQEFQDAQDRPKDYCIQCSMYKDAGLPCRCSADTVAMLWRESNQV